MACQDFLDNIENLQRAREEVSAHDHAAPEDVATLVPRGARGVSLGSLCISPIPLVGLTQPSSDALGPLLLSDSAAAGARDIRRT